MKIAHTYLQKTHLLILKQLVRGAGACWNILLGRRLVGAVIMPSLSFAKAHGCHLFFFLFSPFPWVSSLCSSRWAPFFTIPFCLAETSGSHLPRLLKNLFLYFSFFFGRCHFVLSLCCTPEHPYFSERSFCTHLVPWFSYLVTQLLQLPPGGSPAFGGQEDLCSWVSRIRNNRRFSPWQTTVPRALHGEQTKTHF